MTPIRLTRHARYNLPETLAERHGRLMEKARVARFIQDAADDGWIDQAEASSLIEGLRDARELMADEIIEKMTAGATRSLPEFPDQFPLGT